MSKLSEHTYILRNYVDVTLLLAEVYSCKLCRFHALHSSEICGHLRDAHTESLAGAAGGLNLEILDDTAGTSSSSVAIGTRCQEIIRDIRNLDSVRSLPLESINLNILSNRNRISEKHIGDLNEDPKQGILTSNALQIMLGRSEAVQLGDSYPSDNASELKIDEDTCQKGSSKPNTCQTVGGVVAESSYKSKSTRHAENKNVDENVDGNQAHQTEASQSQQLKVSSVPFPTDFDISKTYESLVAAAKHLHCANAASQDRDSRVSEQPSLPEVASANTAGVGSDINILPRVSASEGQDIKLKLPGENFAENKDENAVKASTVLGSKDDEEMDRSELPIKQETENSPMPASLLPAGDASKVISSQLYGNVDFQAIAQTAAKSNPEATTITVVQHTGGDRPPTTIHFKKSNKSDAIIPTGESLGILSPFLRKRYGGSKIFACKQCHSRYKTQDELDRHVTKKHKKSKEYLCEICGDALATRSGMRIHLFRKHGDNAMLACEVCDYMTRSPARLKIHVKKHDKSSSEFFCEPCKKTFVNEAKLKQHQNSPMHKNAVDPIICEHCGYVTKKRDNFLVHLRKHTGEKPYKCMHCDYAAADGSTLKRHVMARHSSIRPFRCGLCQFSCVDKKGLTIHMRKHTGERPYTCDLCPYAAKRMGALTVHQRTHFRNRNSVPNTKEEVPGSTEVASYVDITDIPIAQASYTSVNSNYTGQISSQERSGAGSVSVQTDAHVMTSSQPYSAQVQLSAEVIVSQETDQSVRALWESVSGQR